MVYTLDSTCTVHTESQIMVVHVLDKNISTFHRLILIKVNIREWFSKKNQTFSKLDIPEVKVTWCNNSELKTVTTFRPKRCDAPWKQIIKIHVQ